jgi:hypothetical protein
MWIALSIQVLSLQAPYRTLHTTPSPFHSLTKSSCGIRGKLGYESTPSIPLFQMPRNTHLRFRKLHPSPTTTSPTTSSPFPHFLFQLRVLLFFIYSFPHILTTRREHLSLPNRHSLPTSTPPPSSRVLHAPSRNPCNPTKRPCFPRANTEGDEYNQGKQNAAVSRRPCSVVECGESVDAATRPRVQGCRQANLKWRSRSHRGQPWR